MDPRDDAVGQRALCLQAEAADFLGTGQRAIRGSVRRAPKVTVTREGDTLCQKGCYPMADSVCC
jgi:hypothetical protein